MLPTVCFPMSYRCCSIDKKLPNCRGNYPFLCKSCFSFFLKPPSYPRSSLAYPLFISNLPAVISGLFWLSPSFFHPPNFLSNYPFSLFVCLFVSSNKAIWVISAGETGHSRPPTLSLTTPLFFSASHVPEFLCSDGRRGLYWGKNKNTFSVPVSQ